MDVHVSTINYQDFLEWTTEDKLVEWVDGEVVMTTSPASFRHQNIRGFLESVLRVFVETHNLGIVCSAPFQMKLARSGREPDIFFVASNNQSRMKPTYLDGPADMVIEILSSESAGRDRGRKFAEYERSRISEYWLIDPLCQQVEFYVLDHYGIYHLVLTGNRGIYHSHIIPGFWMRLEWCWESPTVLSALRELELV